MATVGGALSSAAASIADLLRASEGDELSAVFVERRLRIARSETIEAFKELDKAGYGTFIVGRKGFKTRFERADELPSADEAILSPASEHLKARGAVQTLLLMRDDPVAIAVPADLTPVEAAKIARWLDVIAADND